MCPAALQCHKSAVPAYKFSFQNGSYGSRVTFPRHSVPQATPLLPAGPMCLSNPPFFPCSSGTSAQQVGASPGSGVFAEGLPHVGSGGEEESKVISWGMAEHSPAIPHRGQAPAPRLRHTCKVDTSPSDQIHAGPFSPVPVPRFGYFSIHRHTLLSIWGLRQDFKDLLKPWISLFLTAFSQVFLLALPTAQHCLSGGTQ